MQRCRACMCYVKQLSLSHGATRVSNYPWSGIYGVYAQLVYIYIYIIYSIAPISSHLSVIYLYIMHKCFNIRVRRRRKAQGLTTEGVDVGCTT